MIEPIWIELEETLLIHSRLLQKYGGSDGIRDSGLLHSALEKTKQFFYYAEATTLPGLAAAYMSGIVKNHPLLMATNASDSVYPLGHKSAYFSLA